MLLKTKLYIKSFMASSAINSLIPRLLNLCTKHTWKGGYFAVHTCKSFSLTILHP